MEKKSFTVELNDNPEFQRLLPGEPQTCGMKAGKVYLAPGKNCGQHTTDQREELLVFLSGSGRAIVEGQEPAQIGKGKIAYIPPHTLHDIENTGNEPLIYVYCVAPAEQ